MADDRITIGGVHREVDGMWVVINGVWRQVDSTSETINGVWRDAYKSYTPPSYDYTVISRYAPEHSRLMSNDEKVVQDIPRSAILEAIANGYTRANVRGIITCYTGSGSYQYPKYVGSFSSYIIAKRQNKWEYGGQYLMLKDDYGDDDDPMYDLSADRSMSCDLAPNGTPLERLSMYVKTGSDGLYNDSGYLVTDHAQEQVVGAYSVASRAHGFFPRIGDNPVQVFGYL